MTRLSGQIAMMFGVVLAFIPLLLFTYLALHTRLLGDDLFHIGLATKMGTWNAMLHLRGFWNGHYSSFLMFGFSAPLGTALPPLFACSVIASAVVAYSWFVNGFLAQLSVVSYRRAISVALAALMMAATINGLYSPHAFYWYSSSVLYAWPPVMLLLGIAIAVEAGRRLRGNLAHLLAAIAAAIYAFLNAGFSEMYLVFQLVALALISLFIIIFQSGSKRRTYLLLALSACLGTVAGLLLTVTAPGFANRSSETIRGNFLLLPIQEQLRLSAHALQETLNYAGHETSIAGFMLVAFAGMFVALSVVKSGSAATKLQPVSTSTTPLALALLAQILFIPILWAHQSDNLQVFGKFSYAYAVVVCVNLAAMLVLLALLWQRRALHDLLNKDNGLFIYCSGVLLTVIVLFILTQVRSIHYRASVYLFVTAVTLLFMLAFQLASIIGEPRLNRLLIFAAYVTASAAVTLAFLVAVEILMIHYTNRRSLTAVLYALMLAGLLNGVALGALMRRGLYLTGATDVWLRWLKALCLLLTLAIGFGIVIGQAKRISYVRKDVEIWESQHQEIIRLRDEGDPTVFTKEYARLVTGKQHLTPPVYDYYPLVWYEKVFYGLDYDDAYS